MQFLAEKIALLKKIQTHLALRKSVRGFSSLDSSYSLSATATIRDYCTGHYLDTIWLLPYLEHDPSTPKKAGRPIMPCGFEFQLHFPHSFPSDFDSPSCGVIPLNPKP